jgi:hypothetical protein
MKGLNIPLLGLLIPVLPVNVPPAGLAVRVIGAASLQTVLGVIGESVTVGNGLTVMVNCLVLPGHPFAVGVTVNVAMIGLAVALSAVNEGIFPVPGLAIPMLGLDGVYDHA